MNRCLRFLTPSDVRTGLLAIAVGNLFLPGLAYTQTPVSPGTQSVGREFPRQALRGILTVTTPPEVLLDGKADRLSPGVRIRNPGNMLVMSASIAGQPLVVNFTREPSGLIHEVWLLSPQEAAQKRNRATPERNFQFSSDADTVPRDDGKTPFNRLPSYPNQ